jgi:hypothetical protein
MALAFVAAAVTWRQCGNHGEHAINPPVWCEASQTQTTSNPPQKIETSKAEPVGTVSWIRRSLLAPIGIPLPIPRVLTPQDPALKLSKRCLQRRTKDEERLRQLILEKGPKVRGDPAQAQALGQEIFEITYGKGVMPQAREDFLLRYGCTGWTDEILATLVDLCESRGIVEMGAGHGQWARALSEAYASSQVVTTTTNERTQRKRFDFVLAYDDMSNLPLNTHIYNPYTQPHHDYFGNVRKMETQNNNDVMARVLQSWACRGRVLLLVYPPPGEMARQVVQQYVDAAPENDTVIYIGEGRGGANGDDSMFDFFESGDWVLLKVMEVQMPPGDKGYENLYILQRKDA